MPKVSGIFSGERYCYWWGRFGALGQPHLLGLKTSSSSITVPFTAENPRNLQQYGFCWKSCCISLYPEHNTEFITGPTLRRGRGWECRNLQTRMWAQGNNKIRTTFHGTCARERKAFVTTFSDLRCGSVGSSRSQGREYRPLHTTARVCRSGG
jgi:hypothetical protein